MARQFAIYRLTHHFTGDRPFWLLSTCTNEVAWLLTIKTHFRLHPPRVNSSGDVEVPSLNTLIVGVSEVEGVTGMGCLAASG